MRRLAGNFVAFIRTAGRCLYDVPFYRALIHKPFREAFRHLAVLAVLVWMIPFAALFFVGARQGLETFEQVVRDNVPPGTVFEMKDGRFTSTLPQPIVVRQDAAVFILNASNTDLTLEAGESGIVMSATGVTSRMAPDDDETIGFGEVDDFRLTRADLDEWFSGGARWAVLLVALAVFAAAALALAAWYGSVIVIHAFVIWLLLRVFRKPVPFSRAATLAAYALTLLILLTAVPIWLGVGLGFLPTLLYWVLLAAIVYDVLKGGGMPDVRQAQENDGAGGTHPPAA